MRRDGGGLTVRIMSRGAREVRAEVKSLNLTPHICI